MITYGIHHNDLDGLAVKTIMAIYGIPMENLFQAEYSEAGVDPIVLECLEKIRSSGEPGELFIGDVSPTDEVCKVLDEAYRNNILKTLIVGDHHVTRGYLKDQYSWYYYDEHKCGAEVLAGALDIKGRNKWLHLITVYDCWVLNDPVRPMAEDLNRLCGFLGNEIAINQLFIRQQPLVDLTLDHNFNYLSDMLKYGFLGELLREAKRRESKFVKDAIDRCNVGLDKDGNRVAYVVGDTKYSSEVARAVLHKFDVDYFVGINFFTDGMSFRCLPGFDVSKLCKERGGGGHTEAAGAKLPNNWANMTIKEIVGIN